MSFFDHFKAGRRKAQREEPSEAGQTAPGVRALRDLWQIEKKTPSPRVEGPVATDIYCTARPNGVPHRSRATRRVEMKPAEDYNPPF